MPNRFMIEMELDRRRDAIQEKIDEYQAEIDECVSLIAEARRENLTVEEERYKKKLMRALAKREKADANMDQIESIADRVEEAFEEYENARAIGSVLTEVNKLSEMPKMDALFKQINIFNDELVKSTRRLGDMLGTLKGSEITSSETSARYDAQIESMVSKFNRGTQSSTVDADDSDNDIFSLKPKN